MGQIVLKGIEHLKDVVKSNRFLLVRDQAYDVLWIKDWFDQFGHVEFSEFTSNPLYEQVCRGVELFHQEGCEMIVAVGGGSTIDVAKCIKLFCKMDGNTNYLQQDKFDSGIVLIAVPTTAGTGSESTRHAVIYYDGEKQSISHESIIPNYAVLEPSVLATLPSYQKKCTMLDALCQSIESWWSVNSNEESIDYSQKAIAGIIGCWKDYIFDNTASAAEKVMEAANYAGRAINITATTAAHAMSYKITSLYNLPHGHAVAICLPEVWEYMLDHTSLCSDMRGERYLKKTLDKIERKISLYDFKNMLFEMDMSFPKANDKESELDLLTRSVNPERLKNNPVALSSDVLKDMYRRIVK